MLRVFKLVRLLFSRRAEICVGKWGTFLRAPYKEENIKRLLLLFMRYNSSNWEITEWANTEI
jgi:hypothetical protein